MYRNAAARLSALFVSVGAAVVLATPASLFASDGPPSKIPTVSFSARHARSARLSDYRLVGPVLPRRNREIFNEATPRKGSGAATRGIDPVAQTRFGLSQPEPSVQFEGASDDDNTQATVPPDTEGDVGPNHYIQYINTVAVMYDKSGNTVLGPIPGNAFWAGFGGPCEVQNDGDPLVRYDRLADRWVFSQFALPNFPDGPYYQCFAVSTTNDPTGEYWQYEFKTSDTFFTDYGKLGVWPDAYYMSFNMFGPSDAFQGGAYAFDRAAMLSGAPAAMIAFDTGAQGGALPSDLDGPTPPPAGSPNYFMTFDISPARLLEWQFHVDWTTPGNSTFTGPVEIPVAEFVWPVCEADRGQCVPQFETSEKLETLDDKLMYRLVYRNFGDHESLLVNHTVGTAGGSAAPRWYEIRNPGDAPVVHQQGTYAPDASFRWMGSVAMDGHGNIALGYSKSSSIMYPSIGITGRLAGDPLGLMGAEDVWFAGGGSQIASFSRWGDYSTMSIDPSDDCTFWYTQEYYAQSGAFDFKTRIGAFRFPSCAGGPAGSLEGTVAGGSGPLAGATVEAAPQTEASAAGASSTTTDAAGHYQFLTLPAGTYDVTASKYGYASSTAAGVAVVAGQNAVQDLALTASVNVLVNGTVKDGSGHGWPLYAKLVVSGPNGFPGATLFTDPVTGYYATTLPAGFGYDFAVTALVPGYAPGGGALAVVVPAAPSAAGGLVANWTVSAAPTCTAPGYGSGTFADPPALAESFDSGVIPTAWSVHTVSGTSWKVRSGADDCGQFDDNRTGGTGPYAIINSACESVGTVDDSFLLTPPIDLSGRTSAAIRWANDLVDFGSDFIASVDASADGGVTWRNIWKKSGAALPGAGTQIADMSFAAGHANARARFHYEARFGGWWQVDDVQVGSFTCDSLPGGLVVGSVTDANTGTALNGATVLNLPDDASATTFATPDDPAQGDGFYGVFAGSGSQPFEAAYPAFEPLQKSVTVIPNGTVRLDFALKSGLLSASPRPLSLFLSPGGGAQALTLNLTNTGSAGAGFGIQEVNVPPPSVTLTRPGTSADTARVRAAIRRVGFRRMNDRDPRGVPPPAGTPTNVPALTQAGQVVRSFSTGLDFGWGLAYDTDAGRLWISNPESADAGYAGDGLEHQFLPEGTPTGDTIDIHETGGLWQADGTYNGRTGMLWQVNVGGDNCLFEMDPVAKVVTGKKICGSWTANASQRAVAYDYATDTYYVGGTNESVIYHIDGSGSVLDSKYVPVSILGLAYNPATRHLFIGGFAAPYDVWVVDPSNDYAFLGGFLVTAGGVPVLESDGVSLEADCNGHLWINTASAHTVYEVESGETGWCVDDIPWLSEAPVSGSVPAGGAFPVTVKFDPAGLLPGLRQGFLTLQADTPIPVAPVPVDFTLLFNDVPEGSFAWNFIYAAAGAGVMPGCSPQTPAFAFCPTQIVTRRSTAGVIERAVHGALAPPPVYRNEFGDVAAGSFNANYIQGLVDDGITAGCHADPLLFCPDAPVTRAQMAVFVWKGQHGAQPPPACTPPGTFGDVPCPGGFAVDYIEGIYAEGVTVGCGGGNYCPNAGITNAQMAVFVVKAFQIPYLP